MPSVAFTRRALRDLRGVSAGDRLRIEAGIDALAEEAANLDVKAIAGHAGWFRLRVGDWRVLYRRVSASGMLVARIVNRRDLDRAVAQL